MMRAPRRNHPRCLALSLRAILALLLCGLAPHAYGQALRIEFNNGETHVIEAIATPQSRERDERCLALRLEALDMTLPFPPSKGKISHYRRQEEKLENQKRELHIVAIYGKAPVDDNNHVARVRLRRTQRPAVLYLASYEPTDWKLQLDDGAKLDTVIVIGQQSRVVGAGPQVRVVNRDFKDVCRHTETRWENDYAFDFRWFVADVRNHTGLTETSFQGNYYGRRFSVPHPRRSAVTRAPASDAAGRYPPGVRLEHFEPVQTGQPRLRSVEDLIAYVRTLQQKNLLPKELPDRSTGRITFKPLALEGERIEGRRNANNVLEHHYDNAIIIGGAGKDLIDAANGDTVHYAAAGDDAIDDSRGNDVLYGGLGDDYLDGGWGADIFVFDRGWGHDRLAETCHDAKIAMPGRREKFVNFVVFGPGINPGALKWHKKTLYDEKTGDSITFDDETPCTSFVFHDHGLIALERSGTSRSRFEQSEVTLLREIGTLKLAGVSETLLERLRAYLAALDRRWPEVDIDLMQATIALYGRLDRDDDMELWLNRLEQRAREQWNSEPSKETAALLAWRHSQSSHRWKQRQSRLAAEQKQRVWQEQFEDRPSIRLALRLAARLLEKDVQGAGRFYLEYALDELEGSWPTQDNRTLQQALSAWSLLARHGPKRSAALWQERLSSHYRERALAGDRAARSTLARIIKEPDDELSELDRAVTAKRLEQLLEELAHSSGAQSE